MKQMTVIVQEGVGGATLYVSVRDPDESADHRHVYRYRGYVPGATVGHDDEELLALVAEELFNISGALASLPWR